MNFIQNEIVLGVLVFTIAVNLMVFIILGARKLLVSSGNISISMNDAAKSIDVERLGALNEALTDDLAYMPPRQYQVGTFFCVCVCLNQCVGTKAKRWMSLPSVGRVNLLPPSHCACY